MAWPFAPSSWATESEPWDCAAWEAMLPGLVETQQVVCADGVIYGGGLGPLGISSPSARAEPGDWGQPALSERPILGTSADAQRGWASPVGHQLCVLSSCWRNKHRPQDSSGGGQQEAHAWCLLDTACTSHLCQFWPASFPARYSNPAWVEQLRWDLPENYWIWDHLPVSGTSLTHRVTWMAAHCLWLTAKFCHCGGPSEDWRDGGEKP